MAPFDVVVAKLGPEVAEQSTWKAPRNKDGTNIPFIHLFSLLITSHRSICCAVLNLSFVCCSLLRDEANVGEDRRQMQSVKWLHETHEPVSRIGQEIEKVRDGWTVRCIRETADTLLVGIRFFLDILTAF